MAKEPSGLLYINVQERKVAILLRLHGKLNIPVKAIQMFNESLQLFWSVWPDDKKVSST
jgi:hypothetical protein